MSYIIGSKCVGVCDAACVKVCPVNCIHGPLKNDNNAEEIGDISDKSNLQLYINPDVCIDCGACLPECPVDAIHPNEKFAISMGDYQSVEKNYQFFGLTYKKIN